MFNGHRTPTCHWHDIVNASLRGAYVQDRDRDAQSRGQGVKTEDTSLGHNTSLQTAFLY